MKKKWFWAVVMLMLFLLSASGCTISDKEYVHEGNSLVIIVGNHANANRYDEQLVTKDIYNLLTDSVSFSIDGDDYIASLNVAIIVSDGNPTRANIVLDGYEVELVTEAKSAEKGIRNAEDMIEDVVDFLLENSLRADDPEVDLPAAISEAARILRQNPGAEDHIFIYDTGIVTSGVMAMGSGTGQLDIQKGTVTDVLAQLPSGAFPDLSDIYVHFYGLGDVCIGQKDMRSYGAADFEARLVELWESFLDRCGAVQMNQLVFAPISHSPMLWDTEEDPYPFVRNVPFYDSDAWLESPPLPDLLPVNLTSSELGGFRADSSEFRDSEQAKLALDSYFHTTLWPLLARPELKLYVVGFRAKTMPGQDLKDDPLSAARALAISDLIQELYKIPAEQIIEIDAGVQRFSWSSSAEEFPNGEGDYYVDREAQAMHRMVSLIPSTENNMPLIQELLDAGETDIRP